MSSIDGRLRRLEERGNRCRDCGHAPEERRPLAVVYPDEPEKGFEGDPYEACGACGEPLYVVIKVVYDSPGPTKGEGP